MVVSGGWGPKQARSVLALEFPGYVSWVRAPLFPSLSYLNCLSRVIGPGEDR